MDWFAKLTGFREESPQQVRDRLMINGEQMRSLVNGKTFIYEGLSKIYQRLQTLSEEERDKFRQPLKIGIQWQTQVTLRNCRHLVSQIFYDWDCV
ncbi:MAG: hypothetical protein AAGE96_19865 [Cyanobacteria bacterium P01_G01_bin.19]